MNKKLIIPTIVISASLLLTGCTSGKSEPNNNVPNSSSATTDSSSATASTGDTGFVAPPKEMDSKYKGYYMAPASTNAEAWAYYNSIGAKTYKEDPSTRATTLKDWNSARDDDKDIAKFDKMYGEVMSDVEQSALKVTGYLEKNPSASVDDIKNEKDLIINRYSTLGSTTVEKDSSTGFYFVIFTVNDNKSGGYGILVQQKGITPAQFDTVPTQ